ncbi:LuxR C-terminal-related transcriptional regulator [Scandinavium sp. TWS1a]|uniref:LuxR C-terminal-related transcriptional regulator n=1 Tax=Scandinavium tedordense TaxID=2926521 RepID=UPI002165ACD1|nr:LuxR C-terminal-related transcriptional regulator [Scandinavium tedordense]MCS2169602.1 LuxR C-terminal-related transcriptional regulator [Scandinavium tedordense]
MNCIKTFISDNIFLCAGATMYGADYVYYANNYKNHLRYSPLNREHTAIVAIEDVILRECILAKLTGFVNLIILLDNDLNNNACLKIGAVIYVSSKATPSKINYIITNKHCYRDLHLSARERMVLELSYLKNTDLSERLNISIKTCSAHRINLQNKLHVRYTNAIAMERIRRKAECHNHY